MKKGTDTTRIGEAKRRLKRKKLKDRAARTAEVRKAEPPSEKKMLLLAALRLWEARQQ